MKKTPYILISTGDPAGVGPEITIKTIRSFVTSKVKIIPAGDFNILKEANALCGNSHAFPLVKLNSLDDINDISSNNEILHIPLLSEIQKRQVSAESGEYTYNLLKTCSSLCLKGLASAMVTGPINKEALKMAGYEGGHTEILKDFAGITSIDTIFCIENLKIFFLSRHLSLKDAISLVKKENILKSLINIDNQMKNLGYKKPVIGLPGLNPHSSDGGLFGREEIEEMIPAVQEARQKGINVEGPVGADSIYHLGIKGKFDAILSLYHDQGHIASKTYDFYKTVTMTAGLPYIRTSVDHGTGFDIAWKGKANQESLIKAVELAVDLVRKKEKPVYTKYHYDV